MNFFYKCTLIFIGLLGVAALIGYNYLSHNAKDLLQKVVRKVSKDTYRLEAGSVTFFYKNAGIRAEKIRLVPLEINQRQATLSLERVEIRLHSLWQLLVKRKLEVKTIEIIKPDLTTYAKKKSGSAKKGISETIYDIQLKLFEIIDVLKVEKVFISDAALKIFSADLTDGTFLALNHITLKLDDIQILPSTNAATPQIKLDGTLTLLNPTIHLPDTNIVAKLGKMQASISNGSLAIDELNFSINAADNRTQKLSLSSIRINQFNWHRYVKEGIIELDTVLVNKGITNIYLSPKKNKNSPDTLIQKKGYQGASVMIHHTIISDVVYNLNKTNIKNGKEKEITLKLQGDNLHFEDFSLINGREPAFDVEKLEIALHNVKEDEDQGKMDFSLGALSLDSNKLVLKNYLLETNAADKNKNYLRVAIPALRLENYSLEELFQKRLAATSILLTNPDITLDIRQKKVKDSTNTKKKNLDAVFADLMESVSSKVVLQELAIENGNFTLLPTLSPEDRITISGLSVIFDAAKFPEINDMHDFIHAIRHLDSKGFVVKGKNMELAIENMELLKVPRGIYFGSVKGNFGNGKNVDLQGLTVLINDSISNYRRTSDFHASAILVESGTVSLDLIKKDGQKKPAKNTPSLLIDTLELKSVVFSMRQGQSTGISAALNIGAGNLVFQDKEIYWNTLNVNAANPDAAFGNTKFRAGSLDITQPGIIELRHAAGSISTPQSDIDFKSEALNIKLGLVSTNLPYLKVDDIEMTRPELNITMRQQAKNMQVSRKTGKAIGKDLSLKRLLMTEPSVNLTVADNEGKRLMWHKVYTGTFLLEDIHTSKKPEINVGKMVYKTTNPKSEISGIQIHPSAIQVNLSRVKYNTISRFFSMHVDTLQAQNITHTIFGKKQDTIQLDAGSIGLGGFDYAKGDSLSVNKIIYNTKWWLKEGNIHFRTPVKNIQAWKMNAYGNNIVSMELDSFAIINQLSKEATWQSSPYEKGYETITGGKLSLADIWMEMKDKKPSFQLGKMTAQNLHFTTSKDKRKPEDTIAYRALLTQMFTRIPLQLKLDSLLLSNARVDAHEISKKTGKETHIFFSEMNGYLKNVKTWDIHENDTLDMRVKANFYGTDPLRLHFKQSYDDSLQGFWMRVRMSHFNMPEMNKLLTPLMGLKIESGTIDSLLLVANGNDYFAYGTMDLRYHDLHAKIATSIDTKGKLLIGIENFFVDLILRNHDNGHTNLMFKERLRKRGIFNFWAKIGLEGLLTNLGIKRDRKERKEFEETIDKYNLPDKYWEDIDDY